MLIERSGDGARRTATRAGLQRRCLRRGSSRWVPGMCVKPLEPSRWHTEASYLVGGRGAIILHSFTLPGHRLIVGETANVVAVSRPWPGAPRPLATQSRQPQRGSRKCGWRSTNEGVVASTGTGCGSGTPNTAAATRVSQLVGAAPTGAMEGAAAPAPSPSFASGESCGFLYVTE